MSDVFPIANCEAGIELFWIPFDEGHHNIQFGFMNCEAVLFWVVNECHDRPNTMFSIHNILQGNSLGIITL